MKKGLLFCLFVGLIVCVSSVLTTMAYLTDTDEITNAYTIGNVDIILDEANVSELGILLDNTRVKENTYHLMPGYTYIKDPVVTVLNGSDDSYVRILVTVNNIDGLKDIYGMDFTLENIYDNWGQNWVYSGSDSSVENVITYEYRYNKIVNGLDGSIKLEPLFKEFSVPGDTTISQLENIQTLDIKVVAHAIQANGFANADVAWNAFD